MAKNLKIVLFGNDMFAYKATTTLIGLLSKSNIPAEYMAMIPQVETTPLQESPIKLYTKYIKDNSFISSKGYKQNSKLITKFFERMHPDYGILYGAPSFDPNIAKFFTRKFLLAHPSILPEFAGPDPIPHALFSGAKNTGFTISEVLPDVSLYKNGVIYQEEITIEENDTYNTLAERIGQNAGAELEKIIQGVEKGDEFQVEKPNTDPVINKKFPRVFLIENMNAAEIVKLHKALAGDNYPPATFMKLDVGIVLVSFQNIKVYQGTLSDKILAEPPGTLYWDFEVDESRLFIRCKEGILDCSKLRLMQARRQSRGGTPKYFVKQHIKSIGTKGNLKVGKMPAFCGLKDIEQFKEYKNFVDKKFQYIIDI